MALKFGENKETREKARAQEEIERSLAIQEHDLERDRKLREIVKRNKRSKFFVLLGTGILFFSLLGFGVYNTFFKNVDVSDARIIQLISRNKAASFPEGGVEGYLRQNAQTLFDLNVIPTSTLEYTKLDPQTLYVTKINARSADLAYVQFNAEVETKQKDNKESGEVIIGETKRTEFSFIIPIQWAASENRYINAGLLELSPAKLQNQVVDVINDNFSFDRKVLGDEVSSLDAIDIENIKSMMDNMLNVAYNNNGDYAQFFKDNNAPVLESGNKKYISISDIKVYNMTNRMGYNGVIVVLFEGDNGFQYKNQMYIKVVDVSGTWKVEGIF